MLQKQRIHEMLSNKTMGRLNGAAAVGCCSHDIRLEQRGKENGRDDDDEPEVQGRWRQRVRHGELIHFEHHNSRCAMTGFIWLKTRRQGAAESGRQALGKLIVIF
jgi:hypothetical protein